MANDQHARSQKTPNRQFSMPVLDGEITLNTQQAQRVFHRGYDQAARALYTLDVVLRITQKNSPAFKEAYDKALDHAAGLINTVAQDMDNERQRLLHLIEKNDVPSTARYSNALTIAYAINTPLAARFVAAIQAFDEIVQLMDTLWLAGAITSHAASEAKYAGQRRLLKVVRTLVGFAINARKSARAAGHAEAVSEALGDEAAEVEEDAAVVVEESGDSSASAETPKPAKRSSKKAASAKGDPDEEARKSAA